MARKESVSKKSSEKAKKENMKEKSKRKVVTEKGKEIMEWKVKNSTQKWFFSLEEKEQNFLETTYMIVVQICPELTWEEFLNRLSKTDKFNTGAKSIIKKVVGKW